MNDQPADLHAPKPPGTPAVWKRRNTLYSLSQFFSDWPNWRTPGGAMYQRLLIDDMAYSDIIWCLGRNRYDYRLEADLNSYEQGEALATIISELKLTIKPGEYWTALISVHLSGITDPNHVNGTEQHRRRLVFAFRSQADRMMLKLQLPDELQPIFQLTEGRYVLT